MTDAKMMDENAMQTEGTSEVKGTLRQSATAPTAAQKTKAASSAKSGFTVQDLILVAVLLAAGAVLKLTVGSLLASFGMKPVSYTHLDVYKRQSLYPYRLLPR